jgi:hypothetical protein
MIKSIWVEVIKKHTKQFQEVFYEVEEKDGKKGWMEVLVKGVRQEIDRVSKYAGLKAQRVRIDSDDFLILYRSDTSEWGTGSFDIISYVLWQDIGSIKFYWTKD